jgi:hypothetical protein
LGICVKTKGSKNLELILSDLVGIFLEKKLCPNHLGDIFPEKNAPKGRKTRPKLRNFAQSDVMIFEIFSPKKSAKKMAILDSIQS